MERILVNTETQLRVNLYVDGVLTSATAPLEVEILDANGDVVSAGTSIEVTTGIYGYTPATPTAVAEWTTSWSGTAAGNDVTLVTYQQVVGGYYFPIAEVLAQHGCSGFTAQQAADARLIVENTFEDFIERSFVRRYAREVHDGCGQRLFVNQRPARSLVAVRNLDLDTPELVTTNWTLSETGRLDTNGYVDLTSIQTGGQNIVVEYVHGTDYPPPKLHRAGVRYARHLLINEVSQIPDRARLMTTEFATFQLTLASDEYPTGLPEIDAVLRDLRTELPVFA